MSSIWIEDSKVKSFSAVSKGTKSVVRIELEVEDPRRLGYILADLAELQAAQKVASKPKKPLALTYQPGEEA
jgi:hypothetical protein